MARKWMGLFLFSLLFLAGCNFSTSGTQVWIDQPLDNQTFSSLDPISIAGRASSPEGVSFVEIRVNGETFTTIDTSILADAQVSFSTNFTPPVYGEYLIEAIAGGNNGEESSPASVRMFIGSAKGSFTATPVLYCPPTPVPGTYDGPTPVPPPGCEPPAYPPGCGPTPVPGSGDPTLIPGCEAPTPVVVCPPTPVPGTYSGPTPVPPPGCEPPAYPPGCGPTPVPGSGMPTLVPGCEGPTPVSDWPTPVDGDEPTPIVYEVNYWAEPSEIEAGSCFTLYWETFNLFSVVFGGIEQDADGSYHDCICETATYPLTITYQDYSTEVLYQTITVHGSCATRTPTLVIDTTPPAAPVQLKPVNGQSMGCLAYVIMRWEAASDPSGISSYRVQVERHPGDNNWQAVTGSPFTGLTDTNLSMNVECGYTYRWRVRAIDGMGNVGTWSGWFTFNVPLI